MEVWYLFVVIAILLAVWLASKQIKSNTRHRLARQSRDRLRVRAADRTLVGRMFGGSRAAGKRKQQDQQDSETTESTATAEVSVRDAADNTTSGSSVSVNDRASAELKSLHSRLQEKDQTIRQLQQVLDELTSTTATRESVNFLQKQLIASRAKVMQQEGELKQLKVELGKRRLPGAAKPVLSSDVNDSKALSSQGTQTNQAMKAQLVDQLKHAEAEAEDSQQNALELRRLRSELESVREDRSTARTHIEELQTRMVARQKALDRVTEQPALSVRGEAIKPLYATLEDKDDLKSIKGIGPVMERRLNELGITTFRQLAGFTDHDIERVSTAIAAFPGSIERDDWVGKARALVARRTDSA